jgi:hypothetical protein
MEETTPHDDAETSDSGDYSEESTSTAGTVDNMSEIQEILDLEEEMENHCDEVHGMDFARIQDPLMYGRLWAERKASLGFVDLVDNHKKILRLKATIFEDPPRPITYDEWRELWALERMQLLEREWIDDMIYMLLSRFEGNCARRMHEDVDIYDVIMDSANDIWDEFSDDEFSEDDGDSIYTESTKDPLTFRYCSVRDFSVDDNLSEEGMGNSTEEPDEEVAPQQL